jgi:hypothetical protein
MYSIIHDFSFSGTRKGLLYYSTPGKGQKCELSDLKVFECGVEYFTTCCIFQHMIKILPE